MELWIALGIVAVILIIMYNSLVGKVNQVENAFSGIDVQLKKRFDLIPNLVATVKEYASHEKELLENVTKLRSKFDAATTTNEKIELDNQVSGLLGKLMVSVEAYPTLKANENFLQLQRSLNEIEEQLSAARRSFNASVLSLNNAIQKFPTSLMAGVMSLKKRSMFVAPKGQRLNPQIGELFKQ